MQPEFNAPVDDSVAPLAFSDMAAVLAPNGESPTELALSAVNSLILFAAETTARNYHNDIDSEWTALVYGAQGMTDDIVRFAALDERMPVIDFANEFEKQEENASEHPDQIIDVSPEQKEAGLRGLAWYAREMAITSGLDCEGQIADVQYMMAMFADRWKTLMPLFMRLNNAIDSELEALAAGLRDTAAHYFDQPETDAALPADFESVVESEIVAEVETEMFNEARQRLLERAQQNWDDYRNTPLITTSENIYHQAVTVVGNRDAFFFIKEYGGFTAEQVNCLLQFANPVDLVAGYLDPKSDISDMPGILASIRDDQENLKQHYALITDPAASRFEELEQKLRDRLEENYEVFKRDMLDQSKEGVFYSAPEIHQVMEAYGYFSQEHRYIESDVDFLLKFENPLELVSDRWITAPLAYTQIVDSIFNDQERTLQKGGYTLMPDDPDTAPAAPETPQIAADTDEKPSVMERIRQAAKDAKERPAAPKDTPGHKKSWPEL